MTIEERFADAQVRVKRLPRSPATDVLLDLYGLYKQGSSGDAQGSRPGALDFKGRAKFDAWTGRRGLTRIAAMEAYVALVDGLVAAAK